MDIAIIDYGIGNLRSAEKALRHAGLDAALTQDPASLRSAKRIVLPGVGNFGECAAKLESCGFAGPLLACVRAGTPLLGICVGLQLLFEGSEECPGAKGLGLIKGHVRRFKGPEFEGPQALKIPQIGWNALSLPRAHPLFKDVAPGAFVYFVHSYYAQPQNESAVAAWSDYGGRFCAAVSQENVFGTQFHPEKSQTVGLRILENFGRI